MTDTCAILEPATGYLLKGNPSACLFCRKQSPYRKICMTCRSGFEKWIMTHTNINRECAVHKLLGKYNNVDLPIIADVTTRGWPGFHTGDGQWIKPEIYLYSDEVITWDNECNILEKLLNNNNIYIQSAIQY